MDQLSEFFFFTLGSEIVIKYLIKIQPHLKRIATLPCGILTFKNLTTALHSSVGQSTHTLQRICPRVQELVLTYKAALPQVDNEMYNTSHA